MYRGVPQGSTYQRGTAHYRVPPGYYQGGSRAGSTRVVLERVLERVYLEQVVPSGLYLAGCGLYLAGCGLYLAVCGQGGCQGVCPVCYPPTLGAIPHPFVYPVSQAQESVILLSSVNKVLISPYVTQPFAH